MNRLLLLSALLLSTFVSAAELEKRILDGANLRSELRSAKTLIRLGNNTDAAEKFKTLAHYGLKEAQFMYGIMLIKGTAAEKDRIRGLSWLYTASEAKQEWRGIADKFFAQLSNEEKLQVKSKTDKYMRFFGMRTQKVTCRKETRTGTHIRKVICVKIKGVYTPYYTEEGELTANIRVRY